MLKNKETPQRFSLLRQIEKNLRYCGITCALYGLSTLRNLETLLKFKTTGVEKNRRMSDVIGG